MSVIASVKHQVEPVVKAVAPRWFLRRRYGVLQRQGHSDPELILMRSLCDPARVSLDIGADIGKFSIAMLESSSSVIAFEPRPSQARELVAMFRTVGVPVQVEMVALSDNSGVTTMRVLESDPGRSTIDSANPLLDEDGSQVVAIEVPLRRLDDMALDNVGFIKIDVEGHELAVLKGAAATLQRCRPVLLIEAEERHHNNAVASVTEFLCGLGYAGYFDSDGARQNIKEFNPDLHQDPSNIAGWRDGWAKRGVYINNFVFLPDNG